MKSFKNVSAYIEGQGIIKTDISFNEKINSLSNCLGDVILLPENALVLPAFIDQHVHGGGGSDAMDGNFDALKNIATTLAKEGTATFLATTMTCSDKDIIKALSAVKEYKDSDQVGAELLGVHLEGPFISAKYKGAQPEEYIVSLNEELFDKYNDACGNCIKIVSFAHALLQRT